MNRKILHTLQIVVALLICLMTASCSNFFSGSSPLPLTYDDRLKVTKASFNLLEIPYMRELINDSEVKTYIVAFDGTENDRSNYNEKLERKTIVGYLSEVLENNGHDVNYTKGPGVDSLPDSAFCFTCLEKAGKAFEYINKKIASEIKTNEHLEIRVFVFGFSRGAAIGRHFMNLLSDKYPQNMTHKRSGNRLTVRSIGVLFDTVATGKRKQLRLGISPTTDYLVHIIAQDERRPLFTVIEDEDKSFKKSAYQNVVRTDRLLQLTLPGAHSDIGASYLSGVGTFYRTLGKRILFNFGLIDDNSSILVADVLSEGVTDSRGTFDKLLGILPATQKPNIQRESFKVPSEKLTLSQKELIEHRLKFFMLSENRPASTTQHTALSTLKFDLMKSKNNLKFISANVDIANNIIDFETINNTREIVFRYSQSSFVNRWKLSDKVWEALPLNQRSSLELVVLEVGNIREAYIFVNGVAIERHQKDRA